MKTLWAPWRMEYISGEKERDCIFCRALLDRDELTLYKGSLSVVVMNKYPYINGHLLVAPKRHMSSFDDLTTEEMGDLLKTIKDSIVILRKVMKPEGFNVGLNLGKAAGAGIEDHLHFHIVPRWHGDTNAMTVIGEVRVIPEHLKATYQKLKPYFEALGGK
ncbi:MAG: HIT domain-containing protein [Deltaproteobacteria bacterium]|nr:HIT domain-containing protein [Deltaproteobacteria bacterium]RLB90691.1 MAG: HIT family hydrolase [Deltaproteobacteria bacterium]RLB90976.1 MAG: HIT family hydrolase [Deltaproteobacteria bacterium]RLC07950.1 MAG: HIT family hydrolase [Deltaproteobacteria bacterium]